MDTLQNVSFIFENFYKITHARLSLHDIDLNEIIAFPKKNLPFCSTIQKDKIGKKRCQECDKIAFETVRRTGKTYSYTCHCGLTETVAPIYHFGVLSGYIMMGQITDTQFRHKQRIREESAAFFDGSEELSAAVLQIPEITSELISAYVNILTVISQFLTQSNFISNTPAQRPQNIKNYIDAHFRENISVNTIALELDCSRATVMNCFKAEFGTTVNNYITEKRLDLAAVLLKGSRDSVKSIAVTCGFHDQNYFSRVFMKRFKMTPTEYRIKNNKKTPS